MLEFVNPNWFWALLIILPYLAWEFFFKHQRKVRLPHSRLAILRQASGHNSWLRFVPLILRILVIALIIFSLARPRISHQKQEITGQGIDIMLAMDVSGSMKAVDFRPTNRLEAAKNVAKDFVNLRQNDRLGVIIFGDNAFTQCPLTLDYNILQTILAKMEIDEAANGTAIGTGLATAVARLKDSEAKSKVIILLTDGRNNAGEIDPLGAADLAKTFGIKVYPIGVGKEGLVDFPIETAFGTRYRQVEISIDMEMLHQIAQITGTERARRATNTSELQAIFSQIDQLEQTEIEIDNYYEYQELFWYFLLATLSLLFLEILLTMFLLKELP